MYCIILCFQFSLLYSFTETLVARENQPPNDTWDIDILNTECYTVYWYTCMIACFQVHTLPCGNQPGAMFVCFTVAC